MQKVHRHHLPKKKQLSNSFFNRRHVKRHGAFLSHYMPNLKGTLKKYQVEYLKENGHLFTIQEMADFLGVSYAVARNAYQKYKVHSVPASCKDVKRKWPSIEEYKQVFA
jgi:hypothetical protein